MNPGVRVQALTHLDLSNNELGTQAISNLLSDKNHVQHLCLSKCGIGSSAAATILRCWTNATGERVLQRLHFADNALGDACAQQLGSAVLGNRALEHLDLSGCQLGNGTGRKLVSVCQAISQTRAAKGRTHRLKVC